MTLKVKSKEGDILKNDKLRANILSVRLIANANPELLSAIKTDSEYKSLGIITSDSDDVLYSALDEATKDADVSVVYARSMYAGAKNASTKLAGECIGILGGKNPDEVRSGIKSVENYIKNGDCFVSANDDDSINYYAHTVSRTGSFLSKEAGIKEGEPLAYLIAPPLEAIYGLDAALKSADVKMTKIYSPPSETNYGGGLLTGTQSACFAACVAFSETIKNIAEVNIKYE